MIEAILVYLTVPELSLAALQLPKLWRDVIESSKEIWKSIARYDYDDNDKAAMRKRLCKWWYSLVDRP
jgi:hypothetical protein